MEPSSPQANDQQNDITDIHLEDTSKMDIPLTDIDLRDTSKTDIPLMDVHLQETIKTAIYLQSTIKNAAIVQNAGRIESGIRITPSKVLPLIALLCIVLFNVLNSG